MDTVLLDEATDQDEVRKINGITVAIEKSVLPQVEDIALDFERSEYGEGLVMKGANECC